MPAPRDPDCIFCKIVAGQIPCLKLHEDDRVLAFLDIGPLSKGHTLIIPKAHYVTLDQMPSDDAAACMAVAPRLAAAVLRATARPGYNLLQNNGRVAHQAVMHVHFHIIPRTDSAGLGLVWEPIKLSKEQGESLRSSIASHLA